MTLNSNKFNSNFNSKSGCWFGGPLKAREVNGSERCSTVVSREGFGLLKAKEGNSAVILRRKWTRVANYFNMKSEVWISKYFG